MTKKRLIAFLSLLAVFAVIVLANVFFVSNGGVVEKKDGNNTLGSDLGGVVAGSIEGKRQENTLFGSENGEKIPSTPPLIQGETAPEPVYEVPKVSDIAPTLSLVKNDEKSGLFMEYFTTRSSVKLSGEEVFDRLWPPSYREGLKKVENLLVSEGYLADSDRSPLDTDAEVYKTLNRMFGFARLKGVVDEKDVASLDRGLNELLPQIVKRERKALEGGAVGIGDSIVPGAQRLIYKKDSHLLISDLLDGLKYVFVVAKPAMASNDWTPSWNTKPDCYKDLNPVNPVYGFNGWVYCCNCGWKYVGVSVVFVEDCGPFSAACDIPDGCLNLICAAYPNAVWDQFTNPLGTGICGCG